MKPVAFIFLLLSSCLYAENINAASMQEQLSAIAQAENEGMAQEKQQEDAWREERRQRIDAARQRRAQAVARENARKAKRDAEIAADKKRDREYEDKLRAIELEKQRLELEAKTARVKRENEFLDQDLKERAARTDAIQSEADARRNISTGSKELLQSEGKAREKEASSWW